MLDAVRLVAAVELTHLAIPDVDRTDREPHVAAVDVVEVDELRECFAQGIRRVVRRTFHADREVRPEPGGRIGREERRQAPRHRRQVGDGAAEPGNEFRNADAGALLHTLPERVQALEATLRSVPGDQRAVDRADRRADHPVGLDPGLVQRLIHADLIRAQRSAALQDHHDLARQRRPTRGRGSITAGCALFA